MGTQIRSPYEEPDQVNVRNFPLINVKYSINQPPWGRYENRICLIYKAYGIIIATNSTTIDMAQMKAITITRLQVNGTRKAEFQQ